MASSLFAGLKGYTSKTLSYKTTSDGDIKVDVVFPEAPATSPQTVLLHYRGGFLVVGDRYAFFPHWLLHVCAAREWIFVTPDYRLMPESTAHSSVEDAVDAYQWVLSTLPQELGCQLGPVLIAGSSAGGYLALAVAASVARQPSALLLIYGMLDATLPRYTTPGSNIFGRPVGETKHILTAYPKHTAGDTRKTVSANPIPADPASDARTALMGALHIDALFLDYMTGVEGLGRRVASEGPSAIPASHKNLFPVTFGDLAKLPPTFLLHGRNDSAVPVDNSLRAAEKLQAAGVRVVLEVPDEAEHGFDTTVGNVDVETVAGETVPAYLSLRKAVAFLADVSKNA